MQKTSALGRRSVAAISAPVTYAGRKFSAVSMVSTNASTFTLSAFPRPPEVAPPVPTLPPLQAFNTHNTSEVASATPSLPPPDAPQSELRSLNSYIQHVDPPSPPPNESRPLAVLGSPEPETRASPPPSESKVESTTDAKGKVPAMPVVTDGTVPREPHFDFGDPPEYDEFDEDRLPTRRQLETAAELPVISESGVRVSFGSVFEQQKTIVCFIRHFWCPLCQDYMFSISRNVSAEVLQSAGVELVIISNGSYEMIKSYRQIFRSPFAVFTDPTHKVYNALGMTLKTLKPGPKGNYVRHGLMSGLGMVVVNAVKVGMPVWKEGGKISQLGGEFVLGPGMTCTWVHRMKYTRNHIPILQVVREAGVDMYSPLHHALSTTGSTFLGMSTEHESKWMERRRKALKKLRAKKLSRRGAAQWIDTSSSSSGSSSKRSSGISESIQEMIEGLNDGDEASPGARIEDAADLCLWDPSTEQAINVGLGGYEDAIIEEAEVEAPEANATQKAATQDFEQEAEVDGGSTSTQSESAHSDVMSMADSESQYSDSFVSRDGSSLSSGLNDPESKIGVEMVSPCERGSMSSVGSGFDIVAQHHGVFFEAKAAAIPLAPSLSESSIESI
ncbi:peptidase A1 domain-containing protein [Favolaschia claudopus]|uniref:Peptidase A1 domain-containing protein n=1 Tax=Favolaschia claudopus TaxID=2862362 RepID=A0AAW0AA52_9AGAR